jgi:hypothetical protein
MNKLRYSAFITVVFACTVMSFNQNAEGQVANFSLDNPLDLLKAYDIAWNKKDVRFVSELLAPNYVYFTSDGKTSSRNETLDFLRSPEYKLTFAERSEIKTYKTGNTIVISSRWKGRGTYGGEAINDDQRCGIALAKVEKKWKIVSEHCTQITAK